MGNTHIGSAAYVHWEDLKQRTWTIKPKWIGWRRVVGFGLVFNLATPSVTLWVLGWQIDAGRLPKKTVIPVQHWNLDDNRGK